MIVFMDGPQRAGKSTLIDYLITYENFQSYKFDFGKYSKKFNIKSKKELKGFQLGKDLSLLNFANKIMDKKTKMIIDRGVFSTIYYSYIYKRMKTKELLKLLDEISDYKSFVFIFIIPKNNEDFLKRDKLDGFDDLSKELNIKALKFIQQETSKRNINLKIYVNDFRESVLENGKKLKDLIFEGVSNEYIRS